MFITLFTTLKLPEIIGHLQRKACHNLLFATCFNPVGGMKILFPSIVKWIRQAEVKLHTQLLEDSRSVVRSNGGKLTMVAMERMQSMKSVVHQAFRVEAFTTFQYEKGQTRSDCFKFKPLCIV